MHPNIKATATVVLFIISLNCIAQSKVTRGLNDIIASENSFAKMANDANIKKAFIANLDSAGVIFSGSKTYNGLAVYGKTPEGGTAFLAWYPAVAQVASAGDLGFTSGPYTYSDKRGDTVEAYGYYFTIWKRNKKGIFKVMLDGGVSHSLNHNPLFKPETRLQSAFDVKHSSTNSTGSSKEAFRKTETAFTALAEIDPLKSYQLYLDNNTWLLRNNLLAQNNKPTALSAIVKEQVKSYHFTEGGYGISTNNDLVYTYGSVSVTLSNTTQQPTGFYVRVWQYTGKQWKIIADEVSYALKS